MGDASYLAPVSDDPFEKVARRHCLDRQACCQYAAVQEVTPIEGQEVASAAVERRDHHAGVQENYGKVGQLQITSADQESGGSGRRSRAPGQDGVGGMMSPYI